MKTIFGKEAVQVVAGDAARNVRKTLADEIAIGDPNPKADFWSGLMTGSTANPVGFNGVGTDSCAVTGVDCFRTTFKKRAARH